MTSAPPTLGWAAWATRAAAEGIERGRAYWDGAWAWIDSERQACVRPPA